MTEQFANDDGQRPTQQIALYESADHHVHLDVRVQEETVWLSQQQMATLFGRSIPTISRHIASAKREELKGIPVVADFATTAADGKTYQVTYYNLDMILSVGYRVKSKEGIYFRRWANGVLKQHLIKGYTLNTKRLKTLQTVVKVLSRSNQPEIAGAAGVIDRYLPSLELLEAYDARKVPGVNGSEPTWKLTYDKALDFVQSLPFYANSDAFGRERNHALEGIIGGLYQTFDGTDSIRPCRTRQQICCIK